ncbi:hypothetical protein TSOC_006157 [Tetrabaena socialis]|uniref:Uncharacterized protein n=1 Tax=Tetrabaena socialis TaxID=47790 RepID=A0A2J8A4F5_9CHLO|nr:hypothetical protein TSOC_006157 [Tetrabaena socialis]|eukprot:PNH07385.1 hypothetical protein TSOC_006157 [Tetrabaena socialis]
MEQGVAARLRGPARPRQAGEVPAAPATAPRGGGGHVGGGSGSGGSGGGRGVAPTSSEVQTDIRVRPKECVNDILVLGAYLTTKMSGRTKPLALDGTELRCDSQWSDKGLGEDPLKSCYPAFVGEAEALARMDPRTQVLAHKLADPKRLALLIWGSPDMGVHHHKARFDGTASALFAAGGVLFCDAAVAQLQLMIPRRHAQMLMQTTRPATSNAAPRMYTFVPSNYDEVHPEFAAAAAAMGQAAAAGPSKPPHKKPPSGKRRQAAAAAEGGSSQGGSAAPAGGGAAAEDGRWHEDGSFGWAARLLQRSFVQWQSQDEDGQVIGDGVLAHLRVDAPHDIDTEQLGLVEQGKQYRFSLIHSPLEVGEMVGCCAFPD